MVAPVARSAGLQLLLGRQRVLDRGEAPEYDRVCAVLDMVDAGELSKRKAAERLATSWRSISRALDERPELYGL